MKYLLAMFAILSLFFSAVCSYAGYEIFTWKDAEGKIHITDQRPPDGAEIIEITPATSAEELERHRQKLLREENARLERIRDSTRREADQARREEAAALQAAEELEKQAEDVWLRVEGTRSKKRYRTKLRRNEREAKRLEKEAAEMRKKAEEAASRAERLEQQQSY